MNARKPASFSKSITNTEIPAALVVSKAKLTSVVANHAVTLRTSNETKKSSTTSSGTVRTVYTSKTKPKPNTSNAMLSMIKKTSITVPVADTSAPDNPDPTGTLERAITSRIEATLMNDEHPTIEPRHRFLHNFRVIWLNQKDFRSDSNYGNSTMHFRSFIDAIDIFTDWEKCVEFLRTETNDTFFLITSHDLVRSIIPHIHDMAQLHSIFIHCDSIPDDEHWIKNWTKINGFFTCVLTIRSIIWKEIHQYRSKPIKDLDPWFMSSQLIKDLLVEMEFDDRAKKNFIQLCREKNYVDNSELDEFEHAYHLHTPIWWYSRDGFLFRMVNRAFRLQEIDLIIKMGFFIRDLHEQIQEMYRPPSKNLTLYRGQGLSHAHLEQLRTMQGGLFSFNSFLSTTVNEEVAMSYADAARRDLNLTGIVFQINVDPAALTSTQFVSLDNESYFPESKGDFLFTMQTMFRVGQLTELEERLWQVEFTLASDDDEDLEQLTNYIRETTQGSAGWDRLVKLLAEIGHLNKAEEVLNLLIENSVKDDAKELVHRYNLMGLVKASKGEYKKAILYYHKALKIDQMSSNVSDIDVATIYDSLGSLHQQIKEYAKALDYFQMAVDIQKESSPVNYSHLVITYNNIAEVNKELKKYSEARRYYQINLEIHQQSMVLDFTQLTSTYRNLAEMYDAMEDYSEALRLLQVERSIQQDYFPENYIDLAVIESHMIKVCEKVNKHSTVVEHCNNALKYCQIALENLNESSIQYASDLASIYSTMADIHMNMKEYLKALEFYKKTLRILSNNPHVRRPDLATIYDSLGQVFQSLRQDQSALLCFGKAMRIPRQLSTSKPSKF